MASTEKPKRVRKPKAEVAPEAALVAFKGFDSNLACRGYQYEVGKTYEHKGRVEQCSSGFHACQSPFDVLDYYPLLGDGVANRFARVTLSGQIDRSDDKKWAAARITVDAELTFPAFVKAGIDWIKAVCKVDNSTEVTSGDSATNASSGHSAKNASSGHSAKNASSGHSATNASSGHYATNASSGHSAKNASSGHSATNASSGHYAKNASSGHSAKNASSGHSATNASSGHSAKNASSGDYGSNEAAGEHAVICGAGRDTRYKGAKGVWIAAAEYAKVGGAWQCVGFATGQAGHGDVPADTWLVARNGKLTPA